MRRIVCLVCLVDLVYLVEPDDPSRFSMMLKKAVSKAAAHYYSILRGGWDNPNCARLSNPLFHFQG
jgi:hypothetical protein